MKKMLPPGRPAGACALLAVGLWLGGCASENMVRKTDRQAEAAKPVLVLPSAPFDARQAAAALAPGKAGIEGVLFFKLKARGTQVATIDPVRMLIKPTRAAGTTVTLYPATPHLVEWVRLKDEQDDAKRFPLRGLLGGSGPRDIRFDEAVERYRRQAVTDENGRYSFRQLRPGRYVLLAEYKASGSYDEVVQTGMSTYSGVSVGGLGGSVQGGTAQHYGVETRRYQQLMGYRTVVDVGSDGQVLELESEMWARPL